jgi:hypothetical protein
MAGGPVGGNMGRRSFCRRFGVGVLGASASMVLSGCAVSQVGKAVATALRGPVRLTIGLRAMDAQTGLRERLTSALHAAEPITGTRYQAQFVLLDQPPVAWFPQVPGPSPAGPPPPPPLVNDPAIPMPDAVLLPHDLIDGFLAVRALDLQPILALRQPGSAPQSLLRQGRAYAPGRGTIQAGLPLLRVPMVCALDPAASATGTAWTLGAFEAVLASLAPAFPAPGGPLAYAPFAGDPGAGLLNPVSQPLAGATLAAALAVGFGSMLARTTPSECTPAFASASTAGALLQGLSLVRDTPPYQGRCGGPVNARFGAFLGVYPWATGQVEQVVAPPPPAGQPAPAPLPANMGLPVPMSTAGRRWRLRPLPAFPSREAVPTRNYDLMLWRDSAHAAALVSLASALLTTGPQSELAQWGRALAVHERVAVGQLTGIWATAADALVLATSADDITPEDAWGTETDGNARPYRRVRSALEGALLALTGVRGGFVQYYSPLGGAPPLACRAPLINTTGPDAWRAVFRSAAASTVGLQG